MKSQGALHTLQRKEEIKLEVMIIEKGNLLLTPWMKKGTGLKVMSIEKGKLLTPLQRKKETKLEVMIIEKGNLEGGANLQM
jgi:hypothetical protein